MTRHPRERGMATAEYTVGTLGAVVIAAVLFRLGVDHGWFADELRDILERALRPGVLIDQMKHVPLPRIGPR
jgi:uncharacterized protein DUF4244